MNSFLFVQIGDFREAYKKFADGAPETYRDQKKSVDFVAGLAAQAKVTTVAFCDTVYDLTEIAPDLWASGVNRDAMTQDDIEHIFEQTKPTHVILRTPHRGFMEAARKRGIWILPAFADIFENKGIRQRLRNMRFAYHLRKSDFPCVSNHSVNASRSVVNVLGQPGDKVVPWDWSRVPLGGDAKPGVADPARPTGFFAGAIRADKGVGECLQAVAALKAAGITFTMDLAGPGDTSPWNARAKELGVEDQVNFLGMISNAEVRAAMRAHDFVIVPSHHSYPEGLPNTIYEGLASRSVVVISDHPAFMGRLKIDSECLCFPGEDAKALAATLQRAIQDPALYQRLSQASDAAHEQLYVGMPWTDLIMHYLDDPKDSSGWVARNSLNALMP